MKTEDRENQRLENEALKSAKEIAKKKSKDKVQKVVVHAIKVAVIPMLIMLAKIMAVVLLASLVISLFFSVLDFDAGAQALDDEDKDTIGKIVSNSEAFLKAAEEIHKQYEEEGWHYYTYDGDINGIVYSDIKGSLNNPKKETCCATYVSCALYKAGLVEEEEINKIAYNAPEYLYPYLKTLPETFQEITSFSELEAGDIVFTTDYPRPEDPTITHVQIYAGDNLWYNAGGDDSVTSEAPREENWTESSFICAMRPIKIVKALSRSRILVANRKYRNRNYKWKNICKRHSCIGKK